MRFTSWYPAKIGDKRIAKQFAFFPIKLGNDFRWMEFVQIEWEYKMYVSPFALPPAFPKPTWRKVRFLDE